MQPNQPSKLFLPICDNGGGAVKGNYVLCLMAAFEGINKLVTRVTDSHANRQCNKMANDFLASDCDRMLIIDTDILFTRQDIDHILGHNVPLVYGIYPKKDEKGEPCLGTFETVQENGDLATVRRAGRGFMLVTRDLLERMKEDNGGPALRYHNHGRTEWDFFPSGPVTGDMAAISGTDADGYPIREWISEDWFFCERARALGVPTVVDVRIALKHEGGKVYQLNPANVKVDLVWQNIPGWFTEADAEIYKRVAAELPRVANFAEVGVYQGRSLAALATFMRDAGKVIRLHAVDTFPVIPELGESTRARMVQNLANIGLPADRLEVHEGASVDVAAEFPAGILDGVFIDAGHEYEDVRQDIQAWLPRVASGGIISGHDYDYPTVRAAVNEVFPDAVKIGRCWFAYKP